MDINNKENKLSDITVIKLKKAFSNWPVSLEVAPPTCLPQAHTSQPYSDTAGCYAPQCCILSQLATGALWEENCSPNPSGTLWYRLGTPDWLGTVGEYWTLVPSNLWGGEECEYSRGGRKHVEHARPGPFLPISEMLQILVLHFRHGGDHFVAVRTILGEGHQQIHQFLRLLWTFVW